MVRADFLRMSQRDTSLLVQKSSHSEKQERLLDHHKLPVINMTLSTMYKTCSDLENYRNPVPLHLLYKDDESRAHLSTDNRQT